MLSCAQMLNIMFQSLTRLILLFHTACCIKWPRKGAVSIANAPHPPFPPCTQLRAAMNVPVSIANAPHPPFPHSVDMGVAWTIGVSIANAPHPPFPRHLAYGIRAQGVQVSIANAPHPPFPL